MHVIVCISRLNTHSSQYHAHNVETPRLPYNQMLLSTAQPSRKPSKTLECGRTALLRHRFTGSAKSWLSPPAVRRPFSCLRMASCARRASAANRCWNFTEAWSRLSTFCESRSVRALCLHTQEGLGER